MSDRYNVTVQTFLPYFDFESCAKVLDDKRLGKQRVETKQIYQVLNNPDAKGWRNHPAVVMWRGHEIALCYYGLAMCTEWRIRGFNDNTGEFFQAMIRGRMEHALNNGEVINSRRPPWFGDARLYISHASNLIRKDPYYYGSVWPQVPNGIEYFWPSKQEFLPMNDHGPLSTQVNFFLCLNDACPHVFRDKDNDIIVDRWSTYGWSSPTTVLCPHCHAMVRQTPVDGFDPYQFTFEREALDDLRRQAKLRRAAAVEAGVE